MATSPATAPARDRALTYVRRPLTAGLLLLALYVGVIALGDHRTYSGSDAGGKLATVEVMADEATFDPDIGYWAESADPDGLHHPLWHTERMGDSWVQATSLPFVAAAVPLWTLAGAAGVLALPVLGAVATAFGARRLARQLDAGDGWAAFWLVGAASPVLFYAGDFWEHVPALALAVWALSLAVDATRPAHAFAAGLLAGGAVVLRAEMVLYGVAFVAATLVLGDERRRWARRPLMIPAVVAGGVLPVLGNSLLERAALGDGVRDSRAGAAVDGTVSVIGRIKDALLTGASPFPEMTAFGLLTAVVLLGSLAVVAWWAVRRPGQIGPGLRVALAIVLAVYLARLLDGLGFLPGALAAVPLAAIGALGASNPRQRLIAGTALGALPLVWGLQWGGNHVAQWGGRYLLLSGVLLLVVACSALRRVGWRQPAALALVGLTVATAAFGAAWHVQRTRTIGHALDVLHDAPGDIAVITTRPHLGREAGWWYGDRELLRVEDPDLAEEAVRVAEGMGVNRFELVELVVDGEGEDRDFEQYHPVDARAVEWPGGHILITEYVRD